MTSRPLTDADYRVLAAFRHALRVFLRFSEDAARSEGLTPSQHQLLLAVRGAATEPTVGDLAGQLQLKAHSTLELVRRAEAAGLVVLCADPADHRRRLAQLTEEGETRLDRLTQLHRDELRRFRTLAADLLEELG